MHNSLTALLTQVRDGSLSVADAALQLREAPFEDLGYARVDHHRRLRQGAAEVIYGAGKTPEQIAGIVDSLQRSGQKTVLITRMKPEAAAYLQERAALTYDAASRIGIVGPLPEPDGDGKIVVATGGTRIQGERMDILVETVEYKGTLFPVELEVYDVDGQQGILVPNSMEYDAAREIAAGMGTSMGSRINISTDAGAQIASDVGKGVIQGVSQYVEKKMRAVKITLKAGHRLLLHSPEK